MEQFQHLEDLSIHSSCRTCLENLNETHHHNIFAIPDLQKKLSACLLMSVQPGDGLPTNLCELCHRKINDFYIFQQMCIFASKRFQDFINLEKKPCSMEISTNPNNLPKDLTMYTEPKSETEDDVPRSDQIPELVKQEPLVYMKNQIESSSSNEAEDVDVEDNSMNLRSRTKQNEEGTKNENVSHKKANISSIKINLECEICKKSFKKIESFDAHMRVHQGLKAYPCEQCDKSYARPSRLKLHIKANHDGRLKEKFPCNEPGCDSIMPTKQTLKQHQKEIHRKINIKNCNKPRQTFICEECGKILQTVSSLKYHRYLHTGHQLLHKCPQCNKRCSTKQTLNDHINRHNGIKNYTCPQCGVKKVTRNDLQKHINSHTREKKYPCHLCDMVFYSVWNINQHKQIVHEGIKKYPCSYCDMTFGVAKTRRHHEMTHTGEKPHECNICHKRFIQLYALKTHKKVHLKQPKSQASEQWHEEGSIE